MRILLVWFVGGFGHFFVPIHLGRNKKILVVCLKKKIKQYFLNTWWPHCVKYPCRQTYTFEFSPTQGRNLCAIRHCRKMSSIEFLWSAAGRGGRNSEGGSSRKYKTISFFSWSLLLFRITLVSKQIFSFLAKPKSKWQRESLENEVRSPRKRRTLVLLNCASTHRRRQK